MKESLPLHRATAPRLLQILNHRSFPKGVAERPDWAQAVGDIRVALEGPLASFDMAFDDIDPRHRLRKICAAIDGQIETNSDLRPRLKSEAIQAVRREMGRRLNILLILTASDQWDALVALAREAAQEDKGLIDKGKLVTDPRVHKIAGRITHILNTFFNENDESKRLALNLIEDLLTEQVGSAVNFMNVTFMHRRTKDASQGEPSGNPVAGAAAPEPPVPTPAIVSPEPPPLSEAPNEVAALREQVKKLEGRVDNLTLEVLQLRKALEKVTQVPTAIVAFAPGDRQPDTPPPLSRHVPPPHPPAMAAPKPHDPPKSAPLPAPARAPSPLRADPSRPTNEQEVAPPVGLASTRGGDGHIKPRAGRVPGYLPPVTDLRELARCQGRKVQCTVTAAVLARYQTFEQAGIREGSTLTFHVERKEGAPDQSRLVCVKYPALQILAINNGVVSGLDLRRVN